MAQSQTYSVTQSQVVHPDQTTKIILAALGSCTLAITTYMFTKNDYNIDADINTKTGEAHFAISKTYKPITT